MCSNGKDTGVGLYLLDCRGQGVIAKMPHFHKKMKTKSNSRSFGYYII